MEIKLLQPYFFWYILTDTTTMTMRPIRANTDTQTPMMILCSVVNPGLSGSCGTCAAVVSSGGGPGKENVIQNNLHFLSLVYTACLSS